MTTFLIQKCVGKVVHDFFSCGFYGFSDLKLIPFMFIDWFKEKINDKS